MKRFSIVKLITSLMVFFFLSVLLHGQSEGGICGTTPCVDSADIINGTITGPDFSSTVMVPGTKIVDESVTGADIQNGSLSGTDIQDGTVTGTDIQDGSVVGADIAAGAVGSTQINNTQVQVRVSGTCAAGYSISSINADGTVVCELDDVGPSYSAGTGLSLTGTVFSIATGGVGSAQINNTQVQSRVAGACAAGSSISSINADGTVACEIDDTGASSAPAHRVVVATSGGDYTSVSAALAAISPTAADPYVIDVMPGTYIENITMKSYVHLRGAGREVTAIQSPSPAYPSIVISLVSLTNTAISGFTIKGGYYGISNSSSSPTITGNTITENGAYGFYNYSSSPTITGNTITGNGHGIFNYSSSPTITGNTVTGNSWNGIYNFSYSSPTITGNTITGNTYTGIYNYGASSPTIIHNRITGNGGATYTDIYVDASSVPNISFNVYDDITGTTGGGQYNVNSAGSFAPTP